MQVIPEIAAVIGTENRLEGILHGDGSIVGTVVLVAFAVRILRLHVIVGEMGPEIPVLPLQVSPVAIVPDVRIHPRINVEHIETGIQAEGGGINALLEGGLRKIVVPVYGAQGIVPLRLDLLQNAAAQFSLVQRAEQVYPDAVFPAGLPKPGYIGIRKAVIHGIIGIFEPVSVQQVDVGAARTDRQGRLGTQRNTERALQVQQP